MWKFVQKDKILQISLYTNLSHPYFLYYLFARHNNNHSIVWSIIFFHTLLRGFKIRMSLGLVCFSWLWYHPFTIKLCDGNFWKWTFHYKFILGIIYEILFLDFFLNKKNKMIVNDFFHNWCGLLQSYGALPSCSATFYVYFI